MEFLLEPFNNFIPFFRVGGIDVKEYRLHSLCINVFLYFLGVGERNCAVEVHSADIHPMACEFNGSCSAKSARSSEN